MRGRERESERERGYERERESERKCGLLSDVPFPTFSVERAQGSESIVHREGQQYNTSRLPYDS